MIPLLLAAVLHVHWSWIDRTAYLESRWNYAAIGDHGRSRGAYQIQRATWDRFGGKRPWQTWAHDPTESRRVAERVLCACILACERRGQKVTWQRVRWYYRHGGF